MTQTHPVNERWSPITAASSNRVSIDLTTSSGNDDENVARKRRRTTTSSISTSEEGTGATSYMLGLPLRLLLLIFVLESQHRPSKVQVIIPKRSSTTAITTADALWDSHHLIRPRSKLYIFCFQHFKLTYCPRLSCSIPTATRKDLRTIRYFIQSYRQFHSSGKLHLH